MTIQKRNQKVWLLFINKRMRMKKVAFIMNLRRDHVRQIKHRIAKKRK